MKIKIIICMLVLLCGSPGVCASSADSVDEMPLERIISGIEKCYEGSGFEVRFFQTSTIKAMDITDTATGRMWVQKPEKMRWEYESPTPQIIITDGKTLWIHRPDDNQVMTGDAPAFFGGGKGAGFLSDMSRIEKDFEVSQVPSDMKDAYKIKLIPKQRTYDVVAVYLTLSKSTFEITHVVTVNTYGDETRFELIDYQFNQVFSPDMFQFEIPAGAEILTLDQ